MSTVPRYQIPAETYRGKATEAQWQATVVDMAHHYGWHVTHVREMRGNTKGIPDLLMFRGERYVLAELKTTTGTVSRDQAAWHRVAAIAGVAVHIWRPADADAVEEILR